MFRLARGGRAAHVATGADSCSCGGVLRAGWPRRVAPGNAFVGAMLPYSPLHVLLAAGLKGPAVATSGNRSDEPIAIEEGDALARLGGHR
ncbi:MAG: hypothetical protein KatS3mg082_0588 [Nitrospiraceae bacterium]|nr:MAG: hypothetical protein KatS3mg082_0588 [Nitrospiraceae bacterium]